VSAVPPRRLDRRAPGVCAEQRLRLAGRRHGPGAARQRCDAGPACTSSESTRASGRGPMSTPKEQLYLFTPQETDGAEAGHRHRTSAGAGQS
jgi:hypothetical protein